MFDLKLLLKLVGCGDVEIQAAAAGCLANIRNYIHDEEYGRKGT